MNKSLVFRNKLYSFCFLLFSFFLLLYLIYFLFNGEKGILSYYIKVNKSSILSNELSSLKIVNKDLNEKISRLSPESLDKDFLEEKIIINTGNLADNDLIILFEE